MLKKIMLSLMSMLFVTSAYAVDVTGAGATFPMPLYMKWAEGYKAASGNQINYQGVGSGAGIKQIDAKIVNFGATDIPVSPEDLDKKGQVQFPMIVGGIVPIVNLKGIANITLSVDVLAKIYMDEIKTWDDKQIVALNPGVKLSNTPIVKVRRSDGSGTTWNFTRFLSETNATWKSKYSFGQAIEWEGTTLGAKGNDGIANVVTQTEGSIGYVEYAFAKNNKLSVADMIGTDGKKVVAGLAAFQSTWPMVATSYIVMFKQNDNKEATKVAISFFEYGLDHDTEASTLDYVPLTKEQKNKVKEVLKTIK